jgi:iron-sulfur cluster assembly protein
MSVLGELGFFATQCNAMHDDMLKNALGVPCSIDSSRDDQEDFPDMAISLTESAADRVRSHLEKRGSGVGLRIGIKKTGCSGFAYVVNYADEIHPGDAVFEVRGVRIVVDSASLPLIDGTLVDFVKQGLNEAFKFQNPKAKGECGCGESFSV